MWPGTKIVDNMHAKNVCAWECVIVVCPPAILPVMSDRRDPAVISACCLTGVDERLPVTVWDEGDCKNLSFFFIHILFLIEVQHYLTGVEPCQYSGWVFPPTPFVVSMGLEWEEEAVGLWCVWTLRGPDFTVPLCLLLCGDVWPPLSRMMYLQSLFNLLNRDASPYRQFTFKGPVWVSEPCRPGDSVKSLKAPFKASVCFVYFGLR